MQLNKSRLTPAVMKEIVILLTCKTASDVRAQAFKVGEMLDIPLKTSGGSDDGIQAFVEQLRDQTQDMVNTYIEDASSNESS
jgi:hypothetical protein